MKKRICIRTDRGKDAVDGAGVRLRRVLGLKTIQQYDPFLMLDGFDSTDPDDYTRGFPWHPHRGIETVTYLVEGSIEHMDSLGNKGTIGNLQCQWMTAGSGIIHQEMPKAAPRMLGCQLWVNLPATEKMTIPTYRDILQEDVPVVNSNGAEVRVLSGSFNGHSGPMDGGFRQVQYLDVTLAPDTRWESDQTPNSHTLFIYLLEGTLQPEGLDSFETKGCAMLMVPAGTANEANDTVSALSGAEGARFLVIAGKPLKEPVSWGGPIVMNTKEELELAFRELDEGTFIKHKEPTFLVL
ncbi:MAG: pirin family protein [Bacteroidales bacterium]|nr:pirin family protein [Bacteroidales bacterium]MDD4030214.1 pirin family protein [Bacteroidales bacterium]MDD4435148.1 pirin family protein [Bacteroidales bacterium]MDD5733420.1 pirin family protein [Bacteroidales bacterium]